MWVPGGLGGGGRERPQGGRRPGSGPARSAVHRSWPGKSRQPIKLTRIYIIDNTGRGGGGFCLVARIRGAAGEVTTASLPDCAARLLAVADARGRVPVCGGLCC